MQYRYEIEFRYPGEGEGWRPYRARFGSPDDPAVESEGEALALLKHLRTAPRAAEGTPVFPDNTEYRAVRIPFEVVDETRKISMGDFG